MKKICPFCEGEYYEVHMFGHVLECGRISKELRHCIRDLRDDGVGVRREAAETLGDVGGPVAVPALSRALREDANSHVRRDAAEALGKIGGPIAVPALIDVFNDDGEEHSVRVFAQAAMVDIELRRA